MDATSIIVSIIALIVSLATYFFNLKALNQNKIFDEKIKAYSEIITSIDNVVLTLSEGFGTGKYLLEKKPKSYREELDDLVDEIDEAINEMFDVLMANIILLPKDVHNHLDELATFMEKEENHNIFDKPEKMKPLLKELRSRQLAAIKIMRNDIHSDKLNTGLHRRLSRKGIAYKIFGTD